MKALSWLFTEPEKRPMFFSFLFTTPYLSTRSLRIRTPSPATSPWLDFLISATLMGIVFTVVKVFLSPVGYFDRVILGFGIYFFTEALGALGQALFSWTKKDFFPIHHHPLSSPSLSEFWGRRWNLWVQDWITDMGRPFHRRHKRKILASFLFSGFFHEAMVNLPHWITTGESYFGTMLAYFLIQAGGIYVDKNVLRHSHPNIRRAFCWIVVVLPAPLFINVPVLRFFGVTE